MVKNTSTTTRQIDLIVNTRNGTSNLKSGDVPVTEVNEFIKSVTAFTNSIGNVNWRQISARLTSLTTKMTEMVDSFNNIKVGNFRDVTGATSKISDTVKGIGGLSTAKVKDFGDRLESITDLTKSSVTKLSGVDTKAYTSAINSTAKMGDAIGVINKEDVSLAVGKVKQFTKGIKDAANDFVGIPIKSITAGAHSVVEVANGLSKLGAMSQEEYERASQRESEQRRKRQEEGMKFNEEERKRAEERERAPFKEFFTKGWRVALFGEKEVGPDGKKHKKEGTGLLGQELEMGVLKGLKGAAIGATVGLIYKAITKYFQMLISMAKAPMNLLLKAGKFFGNMLKGALEQAKTFSTLIDLAIKPFVLLFTLLFAPILAMVAPVLADVIQKVAEWWPVIQETGARIGEVINKIITNVSPNMITNFGNIIVRVIGEIDKMSRIVEDIFAGEGSIIEKISIAVSTLFTYIAEQFLSWAYSEEGSKTIIEIGKMIGRIAAEVVTVFGALVPIFLADIGTIIWGFGEEIGKKFSGWWDTYIVGGVKTITDWIYHLFDPIRDWLQNNAPWLFMSFGDVLNSIGNFFSNLWSGFTNGISNIWQSIVNAWNEFWSDPLGNVGRSIGSIFDRNPYPNGSTTYNYQINTNYDSTYFQNTGGIGYRQAAPKEIML